MAVTTVVNNNVGGGEAAIPLNGYQGHQEQPAPGYAAQQSYQDVPLQTQYDTSKVAQMKYCGQCGTGNNTPWCSKCGAQVPM